MSLLLEANSTPSLIIKPRLILIEHTHDLDWFITFNQQGQMLVQNHNRIVNRPNVMPGQYLYCNTHCIPINLMFEENFLLALKFAIACAREELFELPKGL